MKIPCDVVSGFRIEVVSLVNFEQKIMKKVTKLSKKKYLWNIYNWIFAIFECNLRKLSFDLSARFVPFQAF